MVYPMFLPLERAREAEKTSREREREREREEPCIPAAWEAAG